MRHRRRALLAAALAALAVLPAVADALRGDEPRCELDGVALDPAYRVRVIERTGEAHAFCGVRCAHAWVRRADRPPARILVTDGPTGAEVDAEDAFFVRSVAGWREGAPDLIRVFADLDDAARHVRAHGGRLLTGADRPFAPEETDDDHP